MHALFEFDLGYISVPTRKYNKLRDLFLLNFKNETDLNCTEYQCTFLTDCQKAWQMINSTLMQGWAPEARFFKFSLDNGMSYLLRYYNLMS